MKAKMTLRPGPSSTGSVPVIIVGLSSDTPLGKVDQTGVYQNHEEKVTGVVAPFGVDIESRRKMEGVGLSSSRQNRFGVCRAV